MENTIGSVLCQHLSRLYFSPLLLLGLFRGLWNSDHSIFNQGIYFFPGLAWLPRPVVCGKEPRIGWQFLSSPPRCLSGKEFTCQCRRVGDRFNPWVWKIPWSRKWHATPIFLPGREIPWTEELVAYNPWVRKLAHTLDFLGITWTGVSSRGNWVSVSERGSLCLHIFEFVSVLVWVECREW